MEPLLFHLLGPLINFGRFVPKFATAGSLAGNIHRNQTQFYYLVYILTRTTEKIFQGFWYLWWSCVFVIARKSRRKTWAITTEEIQIFVKVCMILSNGRWTRDEPTTCLIVDVIKKSLWNACPDKGKKLLHCYLRSLLYWSSCLYKIQLRSRPPQDGRNFSNDLKHR